MTCGIANCRNAPEKSGYCQDCEKEFGSNLIPKLSEQEVLENYEKETGQKWFDGEPTPMDIDKFKQFVHDVNLFGFYSVNPNGKWI